MWLDLHQHILEEFARFAYMGRRLDYSHYQRSDSSRAWKLDCKQRRLRQARIAVAAARPNCPHCGGAVERLGTTGTVPKYCTPKCMQAAKWKRWADKRRASLKEAA